MREIVRQSRGPGSALVAIVIILGLVGDVDAYPQRRGRMTIPRPPVNIDSSPMINGLNQALKALSEVDGDYGGHREKAINHINAAIRDLEVPNAKVAAGKSLAKTATNPAADPDASLRNALSALFSVHHKLADHASTRGRIHADAEVRIAIQELVLARKAATPAAAPAPASGKPGK
jgi:hypothetical protein